MKLKIFIIMIISALAVSLCSCSTNTMRRGTDMARRGVRNTERAINRGIDSVERNIETTPESVERSLGFGANSGFSGNVGNGSGTSASYTGSTYNMFPSMRDSSRDNYGQINTTNGSSDGGMGDMYDDTDMARNSMRVDTFNKKYVK